MPKRMGKNRNAVHLNHVAPGSSNLEVEFQLKQLFRRAGVHALACSAQKALERTAYIRCPSTNLHVHQSEVNILPATGLATMDCDQILAGLEGGFARGVKWE